MEEYFLTEFQRRAVDGPCRVAVDVGANEGEWTLWLAERFDHVIAVEPDPRAIAILRAKLPPNVYLVEGACAQRHGVADFYMRSSYDQSSLLPGHPIGAGGQADAPVVEVASIQTLPLDFIRFIAGDRFGVADIDFVKIDCEGTEADVMAGATPELFSSTRWLIEVHDTIEPVGMALRRLGHEDIAVMKHPAPTAHHNHLWVFAPRNDAT